MKKILMGMLALSSIIFAAAPNLESDPTDLSNVFQTGQAGKINLEATLTSTIPAVKYVIYASSDDGATKSERLVLSDFVLSSQTDTAGFINANPKVFVKRVAGDNSSVLDITETVSFKVNLPEGRTAYSSDFITNGNSLDVVATAILSNESLQEVVDKMNLVFPNPAQVFQDTGMIGIPMGAKTYYYIVPKGISFSSTSNGVLEVINTDTPPFSNGDALGKEQGFIEGVFSAGIPTTNLTISATVQ